MRWPPLRPERVSARRPRGTHRFHGIQSGCRKVAHTAVFNRQPRRFQQRSINHWHLLAPTGDPFATRHRSGAYNENQAIMWMLGITKEG